MVSVTLQAEVTAMKPGSKGGTEGESWECGLQPSDAENATAALKACAQALASMHGSAFSEGLTEKKEEIDD